MKHTITDCLLKMLLVCLFAVPASGEAIARNVTGKITDSGSQPIPGAAVLTLTVSLPLRSVVKMMSLKFPVSDL